VKRLYLLALVALLGAGLCVLPGSGGEIATSVLDIDPGVQMMGVGGAAVALAEGAETLYYNPAGLSDLAGISFSSFYSSHLGAASYSAFSLTFPNWGIGFLTFNSGNIAGYDAGGNPATETLSYGSNAILFGFGIDPKDLPFIPALPIDFSLGGRIKYLSTSIGETKGSGFSFDLAYRMIFADMHLGPVGLSDLAFGITATNLFGGVNYDAHSESMRMSLRLGGAARIAEVVLLTSDLDLAGKFHAGAEYRPIQNLAVRLGMLTQPGGISITLGLGIDVEGFLIDYAYITHPGLSGSHRVSLAIDFSSLDLRTLGTSLRRILP
jgi:hypothetical protein